MLRKKETEVRPAFRSRRTVGKSLEPRDGAAKDDGKPAVKSA
jgi:CPA2 family monovalent cation:H+ antiporter-2